MTTQTTGSALRVVTTRPAEPTPDDWTRLVERTQEENREKDRRIAELEAALNSGPNRSWWWRRKRTDTSAPDDTAAETTQTTADVQGTGAQPVPDTSGEAEPPKAEEPQEPKVTITTRFTSWWQHRRDVLNEAYQQRERELSVYRGEIIKPRQSRLALLKPRWWADQLVYALNHVLLLVLFWHKRPFWVFVPRPGLAERYIRSGEIIRAEDYDETKFASIETFKGGVGKTTIALLLAMRYRLRRRTMVTVVEDCNLDHGTMPDRIKLTTARSMRDAVEAIRRQQVTSLARLQYFMNELRLGLLVLVMSSRSEYQKPWRVTREELQSLHAKMKEYASVVFCDLGTSSESESNIVALEDSHGLVILTTPAKDSVQQCIKTLGWHLGNDDPRNVHLGRNAVILVNRWWSFWWFFTRPSKIRGQVFEGLARDYLVTKCRKEGLPVPMEFDPSDVDTAKQAIETLLSDVKFLVVSSSLWLALGRRVSNLTLSPRIRVQFDELNAILARIFTLTPPNPTSPEGGRHAQSPEGHEATRDNYQQPH